MKKNIHTFIECENDYKDSNIVMFGAPYDSTTSYRPGARFAGSAIRNESYSIETYSPYLDMDLMDINVFDQGELELSFGSPKGPLEDIKRNVDIILKSNKIPFMIGGEHLVTLGAVRSVYEKYNDLHIIHFDAHTDLREEYLGESLSHATVIKRCHDLVGDGHIFQFGIRSGERAEFEWAKKHTYLHKFDFDTLEDVVAKLKGKPVYFTLDLDVLDPCEFPGTGTPEAGGVSYKELIKAISMVMSLNVVAADMVELSPVYDQSGISTSLACKLVREILLQL